MVNISYQQMLHFSLPRLTILLRSYSMATRWWVEKSEPQTSPMKPFYIPFFGSNIPLGVAPECSDLLKAKSTGVRVWTCFKHFLPRYISWLGVMYSTQVFFRVFECIMFVIPAFLPTWQLRSAVLFSYFLIHIAGIQKKYKDMKLNLISSTQPSAESPW